MRITVERCRAHDRRFRDLRLTTEQGLRTALAGNEFRLHYQPEMRLTDGGVSGFEALIRWHHPDRGLLTPGTFLPVARSAGLIEDIDTWVLKLDQSLTADVARRADAAAVTKAAIDMGHALDLVDLAEGV
ncbi:MAG: EAL domain-containing protein [Frankiaceae bacterium]